jgi:hypothetical protein
MGRAVSSHNLDTRAQGPGGSRPPRVLSSTLPVPVTYLGVLWGSVATLLLGFELEVLCLQGGRCHLNHTPAPFCFGYFGVRVWLYAQAGGDHHPPIDQCQGGTSISAPLSWQEAPQ